MAIRFAHILAPLLVLVCFSEFTTSAPPADTSLEGLLKQLSDLSLSTAKQIKDSIQIPDEIEKDKVYQQIKASAQKTLDQAVETFKKYEKEGKPVADEVKANFEKITKQLNETIKHLKEKETQVKLEKIYESTIQSMKKLSEQTQELAKSLGLYNLIPESVVKAAQETYEETQKYAQKVQQKVSDLIEEQKKTRRSA